MIPPPDRASPSQIPRRAEFEEALDSFNASKWQGLITEAL